MNKKQFLERMVEHTDSPKGEARKHLEAFTTTITEALKAGEEVQLPGFGKFYVREQKAREGKNPQTGERMQIGARKVPAFKAGKSLKSPSSISESFWVALTGSWGSSSRHTQQRSVHPSAWKGNSANFAVTEFSEVQQSFRSRA
jgi:DNA-binding protein HU-beta